MDTLQQIKDEFLVCPICLRHYKEPKLLPCLHTFCLRCLEDFVHKTENRNHIENGDTTDEDHNSVIFKCPVCRGDTTFTLSEDGKKIESGFSDNHLISNIMEKIDVHKEEQICESCSARGQGQKAAKAEVYCQNCKVSFCESCIKAHNVIKACRDHVIISLSDIRVNPLQTLKNTKREIPCSEHKDKVLEFYCLDCRVAICSTCVAVQHRRCEMVETCADSAQKLKPETDNVLKDLDTQEVSLTDWQQEHLREIEELEENKSSLITEIKTVRKNVDYHLAKLEQSLLEELDVKHTNAIMSVKERLQEIEDLKKNLENTNRFLRHLVQFGSDSEFLSVFDKVKQQIIEMNTGINRRKIAKLLFRHKFALDMNLSRIFDLKSLGKLVDVVDMNKDSFPMNGENGLGPPSPVRKSSIKRTGTFRVDKAEEEQQAQQQEKIKPQKQQIALQPIPSQSKHSSRSSLSTNSPSTSNDSMSSQEMLDSTPRRHAVSIRARQQQETSARLAAGSTGSLPRAAKRVNSAVEFRKSQAVQSTPSKGAKTPPIQRRRAQSTVNGRPPVGGEKPVRPERRSKTPDHGMLSPTGTPVLTKKSTEGVLSPPLARRSEITPPKSPKQPRPAPLMDKTNAQLLCAFNGRTESDNKKCWPLDVTVLCDGTPVITDFHNKKIKAFDASGSVMCDVLLPSWPHGIANVEKSDVAVTLPEISTLVFVTVNEKTMLLQKRIKTVKQYRGICCFEDTSGGKPVIIVSCCASNNQSVDVLSLDGEILKSHRHDNRQQGRTLFTWPYYVTVNNEGEIIVSDCETKTGLLYLDKKGDVKYDYLAIQVVIQDPRGICTDLDGNVYLADKSAHAIHSLTSDGHYRKCVVSARDELVQPIAVCVSPFGHIIVTQDNGDIKVYAID
ncbi:E3 ubiquitin-protein ligase TRIM33-like [Ruditapes philippinarum]|uniref:E3 ubiquitin-protein ligase TRIM33-like n=1 Tax=Ruditapes philippinarum TaxID=129788 RepID=UPI00295A6BDD|nr:E3 ubiquitin-protein ligase TRIM33-like [Ruditapes philippinarum]XP_060568996.1 E3 ubiquitin-protein ligase TRIM33-like [Ruditapes philippinarum]XP_060568997.1 E3 ubiquitin-protein ligase TRIM33-like [Ruditapes philippinarum]XP_060568998.1 E3 ubiquitin-protein ligase TRIM33-like [Ruditapes philippinarum]XP_060568999.1 E3 ubiquitin-protein ligase TRIM33-like [Ruditapes philippinarum]